MTNTIIKAIAVNRIVFFINPKYLLSYKISRLLPKIDYSTELLIIERSFVRMLPMAV